MPEHRCKLLCFAECSEAISVKKGDYYNQPTQKAMKLGLFELKKTSITKPDGSVLVTTITKVTGKGQIYFVNKFLGKDAA
ncbi:MAG: phage antirepressor KilAC domain-containing protein [Bacteroides sp.]|nr:phage antirepressor KilAC domain-containing protein [Bacteroides sp.]